MARGKYRTEYGVRCGGPCGCGEVLVELSPRTKKLALRLARIRKGGKHTPKVVRAVITEVK